MCEQKIQPANIQIQIKFSISCAAKFLEYNQRFTTRRKISKLKKCINNKNEIKTKS
jgi:hypothetical protein